LNENEGNNEEDEDEDEEEEFVKEKLGFFSSSSGKNMKRKPIPQFSLLLVLFTLDFGVNHTPILSLSLSRFLFFSLFK